MLSTSTRSDRRRGRIGVAGVVVGAALVLGACGTDDAAITVEGDRPEGSGAPEGASLLFAASDRTAQVQTGRMRLTVQYSGDEDGRAIDGTITADGQFDHAAARSSTEIDMGDFLAQMAESGGEAAPAGMDDLRVVQVVDGPTIYVKVEGTTLPGVPTGWISMDAAQAGPGSPLGSFGSPMGGVSGPGGFLASLEEAGATVDEISPDRHDGDDVTRYEGTIDPEAAAANAPPERRDEVEQLLSQGGLGEIPFTAWVDEDGVVRRVDLEMSVSADGADGRVVLSMELYDLGGAVDIEVPLASEVTPIGETMLGMLPTS